MCINYFYYDSFINIRTHKLPVTYKDYFKFRSQIHSRATRNNIDLHIPKATSNYGYNSIKVIGAKIFNQLPEGIKKHKQKKKKYLAKIYLLTKY